MAIDDYPWAVLGVTMHPTDIDTASCATVAIQALLRVAPDEYERYIQLVAASTGQSITQRVRERLPPEDQQLRTLLARASTIPHASVLFPDS